ncbi:hypothetical protein Bbelb_186130 [Branchiostoma belcheri]|nr:hypothetical protein Bbelb_186130 [Branchiostoma belcheri]
MARTISWEQRAQLEEKARHRRSMRTLRAALAVFSVLLLGVGSTGIGLGAAAVYTPGGKITSRNSMSPICCGACVSTKRFFWFALPEFKLMAITALRRNTLASQARGAAAAGYITPNP